MQPHFNGIELLAERSPNDYAVRNSPTRRSYGPKAMEVLVVVRTNFQVELKGEVGRPRLGTTLPRVYSQGTHHAVVPSRAPCTSARRSCAKRSKRTSGRGVLSEVAKTGVKSPRTAKCELQGYSSGANQHVTYVDPHNVQVRDVRGGGLSYAVLWRCALVRWS